MLAFADVIATFGTTYTVERRDPTEAGPDGEAVEADPDTFDVLAYVQPASGDVLGRLSQGERLSETRVMYTTTKLQSYGAPDRVLLGDGTFEVSDVEDWTVAGGDYFKVTLTRVIAL